MADQIMTDRDSPVLTDPLAQGSHKSQTAHIQPNDRDHFVQESVGSGKKPRNHDVRILNKLTNALSRTHLDDDQPGQLEDSGGKQKRKARQAEGQQASKRTRQASTNNEPGNRRKSKQEARKARQAEGKKASKKTTPEQTKVNGRARWDEPRKTRSMTGDLPLGFDNSYLRNVGDRKTFMSNVQIRSWMESVFDPHLETWYRDCLSMPSCQSHLASAQEDPSAFAEAVLQELIYQHDSSRLVRTLTGEAAGCPTAFHLDLEQRNCLTFVQHKAMVACLVVRDGRRAGQFAKCTRERKLHRAAVMLLVSVIMDLKNESGYFSRLLVGVNEGTTYSNPMEPLVVKQKKVKMTSKTTRFPSHLLEHVEKVLSEWKRQSTHCKFSFDKTVASETMCAVHLVGSKGQVGGMMKTISKMVESSAP